MHKQVLEETNYIDLELLECVFKKQIFDIAICVLSSPKHYVNRLVVGGSNNYCNLKAVISINNTSTYL